MIATSPPKAHRRLRLAALSVAIAVAAYAIVAGLVAPPLVKRAIVAQAHDRLGRVVVIDDLTFNPFTFVARAKGFRILEPDGKTPFASFDSLDIDGSITSAWRLAPVADHVTLAGLKVNLVRDSDTHYNVSDILGRLAAAPPKADSPKAASRKFEFSLSNIRLTGARIDFDDRPKGAHHTVSDIDVAIPFISNLPTHLKEFVQPTFAAKVNGAPLHLKGETLPFENSLRTHIVVDLDALDLPRYAEYSPEPLPVRIDSGKLDARLSVRFTQTAGKDPSVDVAGTMALHGVKVTAPDDGGSVEVGNVDADIASLDPLAGLLKVRSLKIGNAAATRGPIRLPATEAGDIVIDMKKKRVEVASLASKDASIQLTRAPDGSVEMPVKVALQKATRDESGPGWLITLGKLTLDGYQVALRDTAVKPAIVHRINVAHLEASGLSSEKGAKSAVAAHLALDKSGSVDLESTVVLAPFELDAKIDAGHVDIVPARRYVEQFRTVALKSGFAFAKGALSVRGEGNAMQVAYTGTAGVTKLATLDTANGEDLVNWDAVRVSGMKLRWSHDAPIELAIAEIGVDKAYSRIVVNPDGKLNLQQLRNATPKDEAAPAAPEPAKPRNIRIDRIIFKDSRLNFTDHFIKPNYTADVGELAGTVTNLSSDPSVRAVVDLKGRYDQSSPVTIAGTANPLSGDLFLDIAAKGQDIELPKLSAYSARYAGYGITKGKLTLDVKYHVEDGKMQGRNNIFLDQLTFGDRVEGPDATKLPVLFAVNLLKNAKGEINLELPVSGSLDDPQFEVGALVGQVVVNLLKKALTSPFSLLTAAFGSSGAGDGSGGDDLAYVDFAPGVDQVAPAGAKKLDAVGKALLDRPAIKLELACINDAERELPALKKAALRAKLKAASEEDYARLVKAEYNRLVPPPPAKEGQAKQAPPPQPTPAEMEAFLLARTDVGDEELAALATRRSEAVKAYLVSRGLPAERVLDAATPPSPSEKPSTSRVVFALK